MELPASVQELPAIRTLHRGLDATLKASSRIEDAVRNGRYHDVPAILLQLPSASPAAMKIREQTRSQLLPMLDSAYRDNRHEQMLEIATTLNRMDPDNRELARHVSDTLCAAGQKAEDEELPARARNYYQVALEVDPQNQRAQSRTARHAAQEAQPSNCACRRQWRRYCHPSSGRLCPSCPPPISFRHSGTHFYSYAY